MNAPNTTHRSRITNLPFPVLFAPQIRSINQSSRMVSRCCLLSASALMAVVFWAAFTHYDESVIGTGVIMANLKAADGSGDLPYQLSAMLNSPVTETFVREGSEFQKEDVLIRQDIRKLQIEARKTSEQISKIQWQVVEEESATRSLALDRELIELISYLEKINLMINQSVIKAPYDGVVTKIDIAKGEILDAGRISMQIAPTNKPFWIEVTIDSLDIGLVQMGQRIEIFPETFEQMKDRPLKGEVIFVPRSTSRPNNDDGEKQEYVVTAKLDESELKNPMDRDRIKIGTQGRCVIHTGATHSRLYRFVERVLRRVHE